MRRLFLLLLTFAVTISLQAKEHPCLLHTKKGIAEMKSSQGKVPLFDRSFKELKELADEALKAPIVVPIPKDAGGGYTHEQHKNNYLSMWNAGVVYQITGKKEYAAYVHKMLMEYAKMYPTLGYHPDKKSRTTGKIFWQTLNDCVWLVHTSVAYDCVYDYISEADRKVLEKDLFMPMAEFISNGNKPNLDVFNKMHNHGTWATAAVGMIGYVMDNKDLTEKALKGFDKDGKGGFLLQLEELFSPDGYYTEGPYYLRYAIWPFLMFAQSIQNNEPDVKVFERNDAILIKAANAEFQMMYNNIVLFLNDALYKDIHTNELVYAIDIAYANAPKKSRELLSIAKEQNRVIICDAGFKTAKAVADGQALPFIGKPMLLRDGGKGDQGAVSILRYGQNPDQTCLVMKATSHGLSHGHYDKLSFSFYDNGATILQDYGAVRFLNIEPKYGGHYTVENNTFGKQTIGHNTLVVDQISHFRGDIKESSKYWSEQLFFDVQLNIQITSAREVNAYKDNVQMQRTMALVKTKDMDFPFAIDILRAKSEKEHTYDLPFYYLGHMVSSTFEDFTTYTEEQKPLGNKVGYKHLWLEATGKTANSNACYTWVNGNRFYSITTLSDANTEFFLTRLGANDPNFNLRHDPALILRQNDAKDHTFVSIIEPHGLYDLKMEITNGYASNVEKVTLLLDNDEYSVVKVNTKNGGEYTLLVSNNNTDAKAKHNVEVEGKKYSWTGTYSFITK